MAWTSKAPSIDATAVVHSDTAQLYQEVEILDLTPEITIQGSTLQSVFDVEILDLAPAIDVFSNTPQLYQDVEVAQNSPDIGIANPVNTTPYIYTPTVFPPNGSVDISPAVVALIPACDVIPETEIRSNLLTFSQNYTYPIQSIGIDDSKTVIRVDTGSGFVIAYSNGSQQNGWTVSKVVNDQNGYDYSVSGQFIPNSTITIETTLFDHTNTFVSCETTTFDTSSYSTIGISGIFIVADDVLRIDFTGQVVTLSNSINLDQMTIENVSGGTEASITELLPAYSQIDTRIFVKIHNLQYENLYKLTIPLNTVFGRDGSSISSTFIVWRMHKAKAEYSMSSMARLYSKDIGGTIRSILEALSISDEEIGGDF